ncbi:protein BatD [Candidatus Sumerlaeota bacterium]|nr:protein BatD [Candidatus Sumerlaeota bacterium]
MASRTDRTRRGERTGFSFPTPTGIAVLCGMVAAAFFVAPARGEIQIDASVSQQAATLGAQVRYTVAIQARDERLDRSRVADISAPKAQGLRLRSVAPSTNESVRMVNFSVEGTLTYSWQLVAMQEGTARIEPSSVTYNGKEYPLPPFEIQVVRDASAVAQPDAPSLPGGTLPPQSEYPELDRQLRGRLFASLVLSNPEPFLQETLTAECVLYVDPGLIDTIRGPSWQAPPWVDFFAEQVPQNELRATDTTLAGRLFKAVVIGRFLLTPTRSGEIRIPLNEAQCGLRVRTSSRRSFEDRFFGDMSFGFGPSLFDDMNVATVRLPIAPATLEVRALPSDGRPASFQNAVGQFEFKAEPDRAQMTEDDLLALRCEVSGQGYLGSVAEPRLPEMPGWASAGSDVKTEATHDLKALGGSKTFEFLLRPQRSGTLSIPAIEYSFFDPKHGRYETRSAGPFRIPVAKGQAKEPLIVSGGATATSASNGHADEPQFFGERIAHIHAAPPNRAATLPVYRNGVFLGLQAVPPLAVLLALGFRLRRDWRERHRDRLHVRSAGTRARRELRRANAALGRGETVAFYGLVAEALRDYLAAKLGRSAKGLTIEEAEDTCLRRGVDSETVQRLRRMLEDCDQARYLPREAAESKVSGVLNEAAAILGKLDPYFK